MPERQFLGQALISRNTIAQHTALEDQVVGITGGI